MGAAVEISTGSIAPQHVAGQHVMLGSTELGVLDGSTGTVRFDVSPGKHILYLKDGLTTSGAVAFRVRRGHCARITVKDTDAGMFSAIFGGWFALRRAGDQSLDDSIAGAEEIAIDEVPDGA